jgi:hypothetical protein
LPDLLKTPAIIFTMKETKLMPAYLLEKPATAGDAIREVSKLKSVAKDALEEGVRTASQVIRHGRYAAEDAVEEAKHGQAEAITINGHSLCCWSSGRGLLNLDWIPSSLSAVPESISARLGVSEESGKGVRIVSARLHAKSLEGRP